MDAIEFCCRWFGVESLASDFLLPPTYRTQCVYLLCSILQKPEKTVRNWGQRFERMPEDDRTTLLYADALRQQIEAADDLGLLELYLESRRRLEANLDE